MKEHAALIAKLLRRMKGKNLSIREGLEKADRASLQWQRWKKFSACYTPARFGGNWRVIPMCIEEGCRTLDRTS
jgi:hypothetical protein